MVTCMEHFMYVFLFSLPGILQGSDPQFADENIVFHLADLLKISKW